MTPMRTLYVDMNGFFASVEQQMDPRLRGKPVAITAVETESGACVAASYEAKAFGVTTGTRIYEARQLCPGIIFRPSRHRLYVRFNQRIAAVIDEIAELKYVRSIDEFQVALGGTTSELDAAFDLARRIKVAIRERVGSELRCSIGIGPNPLLAKIAGKLEKPDGLQWLGPENMPKAIADLQLNDLPGISRGIRNRLWDARIYNTTDLYRLDPRHARMIWNSVEGERFVRALQGMDIKIQPTERNGYGNSKVLAPQHRPPHKAKLVGRWLVEKAAERMRRDGFCARQFSLSVQLVERGRWGRGQKITATQDTRFLLSLYEGLWREMRRRCNGDVMSINVHLGDVILLIQRNGDLFGPLSPGMPNRPEALATVIDHINRRFGERVVRYGIHQDHPGFFERE
ncbi:Y-family DNA polymerase [Sneathiella sp.]|uniref:Y-family DNA polymerase n=1 Tax=Sneathiella sp. TaxID=1964365 RepID=UPI002FDF7C06